jgi:hypothetical protein
MLLTIVAIWAVVLPIAILAISWHAANVREARGSQTTDRSTPELRRSTAPAAFLPACAVRTARPRRTITRRVCPELRRNAGYRSASA